MGYVIDPPHGLKAILSELPLLDSLVDPSIRNEDIRRSPSLDKGIGSLLDGLQRVHVACDERGDAGTRLVDHLLRRLGISAGKDDLTRVVFGKREDGLGSESTGA